MSSEYMETIINISKDYESALEYFTNKKGDSYPMYKEIKFMLLGGFDPTKVRIYW